MNVDSSSDIPLYKQISHSLEARIVSGALPVNEHLGSEAEMMSEFGVSRATVRQAVGILEKKGLVVRQRGIPARVARQAIVRPTVLHSIFEDLSGPGVSVETTILQFEYVTCNRDLAQQCREFTIGDSLLHIRRLCSVDKSPIAILETWMPESRVQFTPRDLERKGLYELIKLAGIDMVRGYQELGARPCTEEEAKLLGLGPHSTALTMERSTFDSEDRIIEFGNHIHDANRHVFSQNLVPPEDL